MNKVWILPAEESWICDRLVKDFTEANADMIEDDYFRADCLWLLSDWRWMAVPYYVLEDKKVITSVHHLVPAKFNDRAQHEFHVRDEITDVYHVYNERVKKQVETLTTKPVVLIPYWARQDLYTCDLTSLEARDKLGLPRDKYIVMSAQRDSEGADVSKPKLEKGADLLADYLINLHKTRDDLFVLLGGWRRQYLMNRLKEAGVSHQHIELPPLNTLCKMYRAANLYAVTARYEGGPQALIECGLLNVPVISTPVGIAEQVLPASAINEDVSLATPAVPNVSSMHVPGAYQPYRELINSLVSK